jgi:hypothetical protein
MGNLIARVNARIGTPGTDKFYRLVGHPGYSPGKFTFNGAHTGLLHLPTVKGPAVVFEGQRHTAIADWRLCRQLLQLLEQKEFPKKTVLQKQSAGFTR